MAKVIAIGQPVNESEREAIAYLRDHLPDGYTVIHNFELRQDRNVFEIDIALLGPHCVHVIDVKGTRGLIDVYGSKWYPEGRAPYHSPLAILRGHAKALKSLICDQHPTDRPLRSIHVDAAVLMTASDAHVQDPGGQDAPAIAYLTKCTAFFKSTKRIPSGRSTDIRDHFAKIRRSIVGRAQPRSAPPCYGNWQVEEKLGGTDRYTEYRAKHTLLGAKRGGTARLRVYPVDPYLPQAERERERRRIENAFRAVATLPGHTNILTVRDFFRTRRKTASSWSRRMWRGMLCGSTSRKARWRLPSIRRLRSCATYSPHSTMHTRANHRWFIATLPRMPCSSALPAGHCFAVSIMRVPARSAPALSPKKSSMNSIQCTRRPSAIEIRHRRAWLRTSMPLGSSSTSCW